MKRNLIPFTPTDSHLVYLPDGEEPSDYELFETQDDAFIGNLRRGSVVLYKLKAIDLPGFHICQPDSGVWLLRWIEELPGKVVKLRTQNPKYEELIRPRSCIQGAVTRIYVDLPTNKFWGLSTIERFATDDLYSLPVLKMTLP